jgi:hypothetical protein
MRVFFVGWLPARRERPSLPVTFGTHCCSEIVEEMIFEDKAVSNLPAP